MGISPKCQYIEQLQHKIEYKFKQKELLAQALTHRSYSSKNNERLEFIGDSILNYTIAKMLFEAFPSLSEGRLSQLRAQLVKEATLAEIARELKLGQTLNLGIGELKSGGIDRTSILADALEALFAAISLDSHFNDAEQTIRKLFIHRIQKLNIHTQAKDAKTQLQELLQSHKLDLPKYRIEQQTGHGIEAQFDVSCDLGQLGHITYARANSRRCAEQKCAEQALQWLKTYLEKRHD